MIGHPESAEYAQAYAGYVSLVPEDDILDILRHQIDDVRARLAAVPAGRESYAYAEGKWTIRELAGHVADAERVFGYRAVCVGRGETAPLPGFDENAYAAHSGASACRLGDLLDEFVAVRQANLMALRRLDAAAWLNWGTVNGAPITTRGVAFVMAGHVRHHLRVLEEKYAVRAGA